MKIYLDLVFILNFFLDLILLIATSLILKRNTNLYRLVTASFIGALSILLLFLKLSSIELFMLKFTVSLIMILVAFSFKDLRYTLRNISFFYINSIVLGGFIYFLNVQFSYKQEGIVFYHNGLSINFLFLIITSPIIIYLYIKQVKLLKTNYSNYYHLDICFKNGEIRKYTGFVDTGNSLIDPFLRRPIILIEKIDKYKDLDEERTLLVPFDTLSSHGMLKCIIPVYVNIIGLGIRKDILVAFSEKKIELDGIDCILHPKILEG